MPNEPVTSIREPSAAQASVVAFSLSDATPDTRVLTILGELDVSSSRLLQRELDGLLDSRLPRVEVDLSGVVFMDSSALSVLVGAYETAKKRDQHFVLVRPSPMCIKVLRITGLDRVFDLA